MWVCWECEGDGRGVVGMNACHEFVSGTRGSGIESNAADMLGRKQVGEMCMCLALGGVGGEWIRGLGLGFTNPVGAGGVLDVSLHSLCRWQVSVYCARRISANIWCIHPC